jgi:outer membrane protein
MKTKPAVPGLAACALCLCALACSCTYNYTMPPEAGTQKARPAAKPDAAGPQKQTPPVDPKTPLSLTVRSAVLMGLESNPGLRVQRLQPRITRTQEESERSAFDPMFTSSLNGDWSWDKSNTSTARSNAGSLSAGISQTLPSGTALDASLGGELAHAGGDTDSSGATGTWDISVTQSLLRGRGPEANLARLEQARLDTKISEFELRGVAETLVSQTEQAYWDFVLAKRSMEVYEKSLELADKQVEEVKERIRVGMLAATELAAAEAESASRREQLITARGTLAKRRLAIIRLLNPSADGSACAKLNSRTAPRWRR